MKKQSVFIVCFIVFVLTLSICYAIFKSSVTVTGSSATLKDMNIIFSKLGKIKEYGSKDASATIMNDKKRVIISVPNLMYKGAYAIVPVTIKNDGNIPARLDSIYEYGVCDSREIEVSYDGIGITNNVLKPGDEVNFNVKVLWKNTVKSTPEKIEFVIKFNYVQA